MFAHTPATSIPEPEPEWATFHPWRNTCQLAYHIYLNAAGVELVVGNGSELHLQQRRHSIGKQ